MTPDERRIATVLSPAPREAWRAALARASRPLLTQTPEWSACLTAATGWREASRLYVLDDGRRLVLPLVERGRGRLRVAASLPYGWGYGGLLAADSPLLPGDSALVAAHLRSYPGLRVSVATGPTGTALDTTRGTTRTAFLTHVLDLGPGRSGVWAGYSTNVRRSVRRAERSGLELIRDDAGRLLPVFQDLHSLSRERWARRANRSAAAARLQGWVQDPPRHLAAVAAALGRRCVVRAAFLHGEPVAALVLLLGDGHTLYWRGAMDRDLAAHTHANALLHHRAIEEALDAGHEIYSFGESDEGSPLAVYKEKFGARPVPWTADHYEQLPLTRSWRGIRAGLLAGDRAARLTGRILMGPRSAPPRWEG